MSFRYGVHVILHAIAFCLNCFPENIHCFASYLQYNLNAIWGTVYINWGSVGLWEKNVVATYTPYSQAKLTEGGCSMFIHRNYFFCQKANLIFQILIVTFTEETKVLIYVLYSCLSWAQKHLPCMRSTQYSVQTILFAPEKNIIHFSSSV